MLRPDRRREQDALIPRGPAPADWHGRSRASLSLWTVPPSIPRGGSPRRTTSNCRRPRRASPPSPAPCPGAPGSDRPGGAGAKQVRALSSGQPARPFQRGPDGEDPRAAREDLGTTVMVATHAPRSPQSSTARSASTTGGSAPRAVPAWSMPMVGPPARCTCSPRPSTPLPPDTRAVVEVDDGRALRQVGEAEPPGTGDDPGRVDRVELQREDGERWFVRARWVVLAAGGIENLRPNRPDRRVLIDPTRRTMIITTTPMRFPLGRGTSTASGFRRTPGQSWSPSRKRAASRPASTPGQPTTARPGEATCRSPIVSPLRR
jgi:hypothetical protein